jgi:FAD/FMN-containing dehydrogenase
MVEPAYQGDDRRNRLVFAQCGVQIKTLNTLLAEKALALPTSGASNGQTIAGAVSTGTHGAANQVGAMQDFILGIHIVAEGGKHYWVERASNHVVTQEFCDWIGAARIRDDKLFRAMVVGFGSFGLVHLGPQRCAALRGGKILQKERNDDRERYRPEPERISRAERLFFRHFDRWNFFHFHAALPFENAN